VKQEISGIQDGIGGIKNDTQEIKDITSQIRSFQIGELISRLGY